MSFMSLCLIIMLDYYILLKKSIGIIWSRASDDLVTGFEGTEANALEKWTSHSVSQDWSV